MHPKTQAAASSLAAALLLSSVAAPRAQAQRRARGAKSATASRTRTQSLRFTNGDSARGIPFEFYDGGVFLKARINGSPVTMSVDTGTSGVFAVVKTETAEPTIGQV